MAQKVGRLRLPLAAGGAESRPLWLQAVVFIGSYAILIAFALIMLSPFLFAIANSFKTAPEIARAPAQLLPEFPTLENYQRLTQGQANIPLWTFNSLLFSVVVTLGRLVLDSLAGFALARLSFPGRRVLFLVVLGTMMIPGVVLLIPKFIILKQLSMLASYQGGILVMLPDAFGIFLMKQFFESLPGELEDAARVDGANPFQIFRYIALPSATPALVALTIFSFQGTWNELLNFLIALGPTARNLWPLTLGLAVIRGAAVGQTLDIGLFLAGSLLMTVPIALVFAFFQRYFVEGVSYSGLKG